MKTLSVATALSCAFVTSVMAADQKADIASERFCVVQWGVSPMTSGYELKNGQVVAFYNTDSLRTTNPRSVTKEMFRDTPRRSVMIMNDTPTETVFVTPDDRFYITIKKGHVGEVVATTIQNKPGAKPAANYSSVETFCN